MSANSPRAGDAHEESNLELMRALLEEQKVQSGNTAKLVEKLSEGDSVAAALGKTVVSLESTVGLQEALIQALKIIVSGTDAKPQEGLVWLVAQLAQTSQRGQTRETTIVERLVLPVIVSTVSILIGLAIGYFMSPK